MSDTSNAEQLMGILINKMEVMDNSLLLLKAENEAMKKIINKPQHLLKKMGLVSVNTPLTSDLSVDPFRADMELDNTSLLKGEPVVGTMSNEHIHNMSWEEIHDIANTAKGAVQ